MPISRWMWYPTWAGTAEGRPQQAKEPLTGRWVTHRRSQPWIWGETLWWYQLEARGGFQDAVTSWGTKHAAMLCNSLDWRNPTTLQTNRKQYNKETMGSRKEKISQDTLQVQTGSRQSWAQPRRCSWWQIKMRNAGPVAIWVVVFLIALLLKKYCWGGGLRLWLPLEGKSSNL